MNGSKRRHEMNFYCLCLLGNRNEWRRLSSSVAEILSSKSSEVKREERQTRRDKHFLAAITRFSINFISGWPPAPVSVEWGKLLKAISSLDAIKGAYGDQRGDSFEGATIVTSCLLLSDLFTSRPVSVRCSNWKHFHIK